MTFDVRDAQARLLALNSDDLPFLYEPTADGVIARWKYADQRWLMIAGAGALSAEYSLRVELDPAAGEWRFHEESTSAEASLGPGRLSTKRTWNKGSQKSFSFDLGAAIAAETTDRHGTETGNTYGYRFTTDEVKQPVVDTLTAAGWKPRKGLFGKLFGA